MVEVSTNTTQFEGQITPTGDYRYQVMMTL